MPKTGNNLWTIIDDFNELFTPDEKSSAIHEVLLDIII